MLSPTDTASGNTFRPWTMWVYWNRCTRAHFRRLLGDHTLCGRRIEPTPTVRAPAPPPHCLLCEAKTEEETP